MAAASADQFDAYFRAADLNHDGKINGDEAVAFFKGFNLSQQVLAQIWTYADQNRKGFLGVPEFYNALRLVTVAQTGRQLTPDIVKSALYGPAASQIPAPRINSTASAPAAAPASIPAAPPGSIPAAPAAVPASTPARPPVPTPATQAAGGIPNQPNIAYRGITPQQQAGPNVGPRPMAPSPLGMSQKPSLVNQNHVQNTPNLTTDWFSGKRNLPPTGTPPVSAQAQAQVPSTSQVTSQVAPLTSPSPTNNANSGLDFGLTSGGESKDSKALVVSGNGFTSSAASSPPVDPFAAFSPIPKPSTAPASGNQLPPKQQTGIVPSVSSTPSGPVVSNVAVGPGVSGSGIVPPVTSSSGLGSTTIVSGFGAAPVAQTPWPKIMQSDVQKYMTVFIKVDKDRDGKISGQEARNLFLSWKLPREVLKKVWDLSDQDKDGMLSFREFCTAVYLMERNREHRPLPDQLPADIWSDGVSLPSTGQFSASNTSPMPQQVQGFAPQGVQAGPRSVLMHPGLMKPPPRGPPESDVPHPQEPPKSKIPDLEKNLVDQLSKEEQDSLSSKFQEASDAEKKVQELEKEIMESREKTEFYRTKMQELILYKSRCDNRLNEISERVSADKREVVILSKKYEDKCKQLGDVASRLTLEEATFRDAQEKKMEIYNAILKLQKGDTEDAAAAQERANKIQSDLEEIMKSLNDKCKTYGLRTKPTTITELPFGWQPGVLETADEWDDEWDKFEDGGFAVIKELTVEIEKPKKETQPVKTDMQGAATISEAAPDSSKETKDEKTEEPPVKEQAAEGGDSVISTSGADDKKVQSPKSVPSSPAKKSPKKSNDVFAAKAKEPSIFHDVSPRASESISDRDGAESSVSGDRYENSWGPSFDHSDDAESTWNFNDKDNESINNDYFFGGANLLPIRTGSSSNTSGFGRDSKPFFDSVPGTPMTAVYNDPPKPFFDSVPSTPMSLFGNNGPQRSVFDSSVPSTPMYNSGFSPRFSEAGDDNSFDNFSNNFDTFGSSHDSFSNNTFGRFDSFRSSTDQGFGDSFGRFDTTNSTNDQFGSEKTFSRFDSMRSSNDPFDMPDPFGSSEPFGTSDSWGSAELSRFDSMRSTTDQIGSDKLARFDSMRSTTDRGYSFDDNDMFSSSPIKFSDNNSPRHGADNWSSF